MSGIITHEIMLEMSRAICEQVDRRRGLEPGRNDWSDTKDCGNHYDTETRDRALRMLAMGHSSKTVANALGLRRWTVNRWRRVAAGGRY